MSVENLKEYIRRCAADPELRSKVKAIGLTDLDGQIAHAHTLGLDWTKGDFVAFRTEIRTAGELSDDELETVSGGTLLDDIADGVAELVGTTIPDAVNTAGSAISSGW